MMLFHTYTLPRRVWFFASKMETSSVTLVIKSETLFKSSVIVMKRFAKLSLSFEGISSGFISEENNNESPSAL